MNQFYMIILMIAASWAVAEAIKFIINFKKSRKLDFSSILPFGGFPSAHSAAVSSLCCAIFLVNGLGVALAISLVLATLVVRDIVTLRGHIDTSYKHIMQLSNNKIRIKQIAHSAVDVLVGLAIGVVVPLVIYIIANGLF